MAKPLALLLITLIPFLSSAQYYNGRVRIDSADRSYIFQVTDNNVITHSGQFYYWFKSGHIHKTQGAYYGKLLHGDYKVVDKERHLLEQGRFERGIKKGKWRSWYESGSLKSTAKARLFDKGTNVREYDANGYLIKAGKKQQNRFTGWQAEWVADSAHIVHYRNGKQVVGKK